MSTWPISPLAQSDLDFAVVNYDFTGLTASELAPLQSFDDAIDLTLADTITSVADQAVLIASMAGDLDDLGNILNELAGDDFFVILAELSALQALADRELNDFIGLLG